MGRCLILATAVAAVACVRSGVVQITPSGMALEPEPRPAACKIEFFHTRAPERPYDELATLHWTGESGPAAAQDEMRSWACALGAHAVFVSREFMPSAGYAGAAMTGTALVYRGYRASDAGKVQPAPPPLASALPHVDQAPRKGPGGERLLAARLRQVATLRDRPERGAHDLGYVEAHTDVWAAETATKGWRLVLLTDGRTGYLPGEAVEILQAAPPARSQAGTRAPPGAT